MIPRICAMPDLSELDNQLTRFLILPILVGEPALSSRERLYRRNFVRLVDNAIWEYQEARSALIRQIEEGGAKVIPTGAASFFRFVRHLENCIITTRRLLRLAERINSERGTLRLPGVARRSLGAYSRNIPAIRDAIEHIDERIREDEVAARPVMLGISDEGDRVTIAGHQLRFNDLATTLRKLHELARHLFEAEKGSSAA